MEGKARELRRCGAARLIGMILRLGLISLVLVGYTVAQLDLRADRVARQLLYYSGTEVELNFVLVVPLKSGKHTVTLGFFLEANYDLPPYGTGGTDIYVRPLQKLDELSHDPNRSPGYKGRAGREVPSPTQRVRGHHEAPLPLENPENKDKQIPPRPSTRPVHRAAVYRAVEILLERRAAGAFPASSSSSGNNKGISGRACVLRSICEAAAWPVEHDGLVGELLHVLLTPSSTLENGGLHEDYPAAERLGRTGGDCGAAFPACPASPLDLVSTLAFNLL